MRLLTSLREIRIGTLARMRIGVLGAGGMGSAFAGFLAVAGEDVVLVGRSVEHIEAITSTGLAIEGIAGNRVVRFEATADPSGVDALDALVVLTKTFDTTIAVEAVAHALKRNGVVVSLQNGLGNDAPLARAFGIDRSLIGVTTVGAQRHEPGRITITPATAEGASRTTFGPPARRAVSAAARAAGNELARRLTLAGLPSDYHDDVIVDVWGKLALAVMGPISAVLRRSVVRVWERPDARSLVRAMFDEVVDVAIAAGVALDRESAWEHAVRTYEGTGDHTPSMCADVLHGRRTEIDAMAGEVGRRGRTLGVPTPVHDTITSLIRAVE